ncbi:MAG: hypothetical protein U0174_13525 [Polyangiaceae bacterium]
MRTFVALLVLAACGVPALLAIDASRRRSAREREEPTIAAVCAKLPVGSLALSGGSRWLRSPATEEPSAAFADQPASLDVDPAGGLLRPPAEVWREQESRVKREAR